MIRHMIVCNDCGAIGHTSEGLERNRLHQMRKALRAAGWWCGLRGGIDYCPVCKKRHPGAH
jgi:hypothetical protein